MKNWKFSKDRYPLPGEICTITDSNNVKVAALLFDRIYVGTRTEPKKVSEVIYEIPEEITFGIYELDRPILKSTIQQIPDLMKNLNFGNDARSDAEQIGKGFLDVFSVSMTNAYKKRGVDVIPTFNSFDQFRISYPDGYFLAYQAALNNLSLVSPHKLSWKQVMDFRQDKNALHKYRSLRLWFFDGIKAKSLNQATDIIAQRIEDYQWAIKKHGLNTIAGVFSKIVSLQSISAIATGAGLTAIIGGPYWSAIVAGAITSAEVSVWLFERHVDKLSMIKEDYSDIAILHEAKKLVENSK